MQTNTIAAPPTVKVGGRDYHVHFGNGAFYLLSTWGIDITTLTDSLNQRFESGRYTEAMYKLAAAGLGTMDRDGNWESLGIDPLKMADRLKDGESGPLLDVVWKEFTGKTGLVTKTAETAPATPAASPKTTGSEAGPSQPDPAASDSPPVSFGE